MPCNLPCDNSISPVPHRYIYTVPSMLWTVCLKCFFYSQCIYMLLYSHRLSWNTTKRLLIVFLVCGFWYSTEDSRCCGYTAQYSFCFWHYIAVFCHITVLLKVQSIHCISCDALTSHYHVFDIPVTESNGQVRWMATDPSISQWTNMFDFSLRLIH